MEEWASLIEDYRRKLEWIEAEDEEIVQASAHASVLRDMAKNRSISRYANAAELEEYLLEMESPLIGYVSVVQKVMGIGNIPVDFDKNVDFIFTNQLKYERDSVLRKISPIQVIIIPEMSRSLYTKKTYQMVISLPWWMCATQYEREREVHKGFCQMKYSTFEPEIRKPDVVGYGQNLALYGSSDVRELQAIVAAYHHPDTQQRALDFGFDSLGQGLLWQGLAEPTVDVDLRREAKKPKEKKKAKNKNSDSEEVEEKPKKSHGRQRVTKTVTIKASAINGRLGGKGRAGIEA